MDERFLEQAHALAQTASDAAVRRARSALQGQGQAHCRDCGDSIPPTRRAAAPGAIRCIGCQAAFEGTRA